jgi:hypothetical protein
VTDARGADQFGDRPRPGAKVSGNNSERDLRPVGRRIALGKVPGRQQATRVEFKSAGREHNTASSRSNVGFQVPFTRGQCASSLGSGPGIVVVYAG